MTQPVNMPWICDNGQASSGANVEQHFTGRVTSPRALPESNRHGE